MPSPFATTTATAADMETNSQYSSCETLDSHRSSECDEKNEVNGNSHNKSRKVWKMKQCKIFVINFITLLPFRFQLNILIIL